MRYSTKCWYQRANALHPYVASGNGDYSGSQCKPGRTHCAYSSLRGTSTGYPHHMCGWVHSLSVCTDIRDTIRPARLHGGKAIAGGYSFSSPSKNVAGKGP